MGKIIKFYPKGAAKDPDAVLEQALGKYESVFIIGYDKEGEIDPRASINLSGEELLFLIEDFKHKWLNGDYGEE